MLFGDGPRVCDTTCVLQSELEALPLAGLRGGIKLPTEGVAAATVGISPRGLKELSFDPAIAAQVGFDWTRLL